jgi:hypothetical protein
VDGWVEVKRTAEEIEDSITVVGAQDRMRKRQARDVSYPRVGGNAESSPAPDTQETLYHLPEEVAREEETESEEEGRRPKTIARRASRKTGTQRARRVLIK